MKQLSVSCLWKQTGFTLEFPLTHFIRAGVFAIFFSWCSLNVAGQSFPAPGKCTSQDLILTEAIINGDQLSVLEPGHRKAQLTVENKSTSDRRSFALWGTLNRFDSYGVWQSAESVFLCVDSVRKNSTLNLFSGNSIYYNPDEILTISNYYNAWSSASGRENCEYLLANTSKIAPGCWWGEKINVFSGVNARIRTERAECSTGKGQLSVIPFKGFGPFTVSITRSGTSIDQRAAVAEKDSVLFALEPGQYTIVVADAKDHQAVFTKEILSPVPASKPNISVEQPNCSQSTGSVSIINEDPDFSYQLKQNGAVLGINNSGTFSALQPGNYEYIAMNGFCSINEPVVVDPQPMIPGKTHLEIVQPDCDHSKGFAKILNIQDNVNYHAFQNGIQKFTSANGVFSELDPGTYEIIAKGKSCSTTDTLIITIQPSKPQIPQYTIEQPSCTSDKGKILLSATQSNVLYTLSQGGQTVYTAENGQFPSVIAGAYQIVALSLQTSCRATDSLVVYSQPFVPARPQYQLTHPSCTNDQGSVTVTNSESGLSYVLMQGGDRKYTAEKGIFTNIAPGTYDLVALAEECSSSSALEIYPILVKPEIPKYEVVQPNCLQDFAQLIIENPDARTEYYLGQNGVIRFTAAGNTFDAVESGAYELIAVKGSCSKSDSVKVNKKPFRPSQPKYSLTQPDCNTDRGTVTVTNIEAGVSYQLVQNGQVKYSNEQGWFAEVVSGAYDLLAIAGTCQNSTTLEIYPPLVKPEPPVVDIQQPDCNREKGAMTLLNYDNRTSYYLSQNGFVRFTATGDEFSEVETGGYELVAVKGSCSRNDSVHIITRPTIPAKPKFSIQHPDCERAKGIVSILNREDNVAYRLLQNGLQKFIAAEGIFSDIDPGDFEIEAAGASCQSKDSLKVNPQPFVPNRPVVSIIHPDCERANGAISILNRDERAIYQLIKNGIIAKGEGEPFEELASGVYEIQAEGISSSCKRSDSAVINQRPFVPAKPKFTVQHPDCNRSKGTIKLEQSEDQVSYQLFLNGQPKVFALQGLFEEVEAGAYDLVAQAQVCKNGDSVSVHQPPFKPAKPEFIIIHPNCDREKGAIKVSNPDSKVYYQLLQQGQLQFNSAWGEFDSVESGDYVLEAVGASCKTGDTLKINQRPIVPEKPVASILQPDCSALNGIVQVDNADERINYYLITGQQIRYTAENGKFTGVKPGAYELVALAKNGFCSKSNWVQVNDQPEQSPKPVLSFSGSLQICSGDSITFTSSIAGTHQWFRNGNLIPEAQSPVFFASESGIYTAKTFTASCPSEPSEEILLRVNPVPSSPVVKQSGKLLLSSAETGNQWFSNGVLIPGANAKEFAPTQSGYYTVSTNLNGCESTPSQKYYFLITGVTTLDPNEFIKVYPNPLTRDQHIAIHWKLNNAPQGIYVTVKNILGQPYGTQKITSALSTIKMPNVPGSYVIEITWGNENKKLFEVIKK